MTEFEAATLTAQYAATLTAIAGGAQCLLIYLGLQMMRRINDHRDHLHAETMQQQAAAMRALETLIERTAPKWQQFPGAPALPPLPKGDRGGFPLPLCNRASAWRRLPRAM